MADTAISGLPVGSSANTTDQVHSNQGGTSRSLTVQQIQQARMLTRDVTPTNINNSATTTSIYSCAVPANFLGATGILRTRIASEYWHSAGATATMNVRIGLSTTTIYQDTSAALAVSANSRPCYFDFDIANLGATNSQALLGTLSIGNVAGATTGQGDFATGDANDSTIRGTSAVDTTSAVTLEVFVSHSTASTLVTFRKWYGYSELIS